METSCKVTSFLDIGVSACVMPWQARFVLYFHSHFRRWSQHVDQRVELACGRYPKSCYSIANWKVKQKIGTEGPFQARGVLYIDFTASPSLPASFYMNLRLCVLKSMLPFIAVQIYIISRIWGILKEEDFDIFDTDIFTNIWKLFTFRWLRKQFYFVDRNREDR